MKRHITCPPIYIGNGIQLPYRFLHIWFSSFLCQDFAKLQTSFHDQVSKFPKDVAAFPDRKRRPCFLCFYRPVHSSCNILCCCGWHCINYLQGCRVDDILGFSIRRICFFSVNYHFHIMLFLPFIDVNLNIPEPAFYFLPRRWLHIG